MKIVTPENQSVQRPVQPSLAATAVAFVMAAAALLLIAALLLPSSALASSSQHGADMVVINPGGGVLTDGSDGLQSVFNGYRGYKPTGPSQAVPMTGSDQQFFARTGQWCCSTPASPMLNVGGTLYGENSAASSRSTPGWTTVAIVSTSGAVARAAAGSSSLASTPTGSGAAHVRYTATVGGLDYVVDREITYVYPNPYYTETYTVTIPAGNAATVKLYQGGDAAPGDDDHGTGMMVTSPRRALYEVNQTSHIYIAYKEAPGGSLMDHWYVADYYSPYAGMAAGTDLTDTVDSTDHDAGIDVQWTLGATPGTYVRNMITEVNFEQIAITAGFSVGTVAAPATSDLQIQLVNTTSTSGTGLGFTYVLPSGLYVAGAVTNACGGTATAAVGSTSITLADATLASAQNCTVTVPVSGAAGTYTLNEQDFGVTGVRKGFGVSSLTITGGGAVAITSGPAASTILTAATFVFAGEGVVLYQCQLDDAAWSACVSPLVLSGLAAGSHTFRVRAAGAADAASHTWVIGAVRGAPAGTLTNHVVASVSSSIRIVPVVSEGGTPGTVVGCAVTGQLVLDRCVVQIYGPRSALAGTGGGLEVKDVDPNQVLIGTGSYLATDATTKSVQITVLLNAKGRRMLRSNLNGFGGLVRVAAFPKDAVKLTVSKKARMRPLSHLVLPTDDLYGKEEYSLTSAGRRFVARIAEFVPRRVASVTCTGFTDNWGTAVDNLTFGRWRAEAVCAALEAAGVRATVVSAQSQGEGHPRASNATAEGRALNRRVEIKITY